MHTPKEENKKLEHEQEGDAKMDVTQKAKSRNKKKKKKDKHIMTMSTIAENSNNIPPIIGYFPSGYDPLLRNKNNDVVEEYGFCWSGEATEAQLCSYSLGVLDKETKTLIIVPNSANKREELLETEDPATVKPKLTAEELNAKSRDLTEMYSTGKNRRQARKLDALRQQEDTGNQEEFDREIAKAINKEVLEVALAYPLDRIIFKGDWNYLMDVFQLTEAGAETIPDLYPSSDEDEKKRLAGILSFIAHLVKFKDRHSMNGVSSSKHHKIPGILFQWFSSMFAVADSKKLPNEKINLLIGYMLVLILFVDDFRSNPSDKAKDLRMSYVALRPHYEYFGCKVTKEKNVLLFTLPVPLKFQPPLRRKRRR
ncbi:unnamed protein product [Withania somnifera]